MGKQYAYCPDGIVRYVETRTENYPDEENPIVHFVHHSILDKYKLIPESQNNTVQPLWMWDEEQQLFREPKLYDIVDGQVYLANMDVKQTIYNIGLDNADIINEQAKMNYAITSRSGSDNSSEVMKAAMMIAKLTVPKDVDSATKLGLDADGIISVSALYDEWKAGKFKVGAITKKDGNVWECKTEHDSTVNIDWVPGLAPTIWVNYHGKTLETALPWVAPTGAHDVYMNGEYMLYTDGKIYKCIADNTSWNPEENPDNWEAQA